jgi:FkbM family methyltransferase
VNLDIPVVLDKVRYRLGRAIGGTSVLCPGHAAFERYCDSMRDRGRSQFRQDLFVLHVLQELRGGFFVEFGAANGENLSNTVLLEREFGWRGICAEPSRQWHEALERNRKCIIERRCIWSSTGEELPFSECEEGEYSTISEYSSGDLHVGKRRAPREYLVKTVSLVDALDEHGAPSVVDYLSIDTEGSEFDILQAVDFGRYRFRVITVEHNHQQQRRSAIRKLLTGHGYRRVLPALSLVDDWYLLRS